MSGRDAYRLVLDRRHRVIITLKHNGKLTLHGFAENISVNGAALMIRPTGQRFPGRGEQYSTCRIMLSEYEIIYCQARIIHGKFDPDIGHTRFGIEFEDMESEDEKCLQRYICNALRGDRKRAQSFAEIPHAAHA